METGSSRGVVAGKKSKVGGGDEAADEGHLVAPHALCVLQNRKVVLQLAVMQDHYNRNEACSNCHAEGKGAGLRRVLGGVGDVRPGYAADVMLVIAVGEHASEDGGKARDCCGDGDVAGREMHGDRTSCCEFRGDVAGVDGAVRSGGRRG